MTLPIQKMEFDAALVKQNENLQLKQISEVFPSGLNSTERMRFMSLLEAENDFSYIYPKSAVPSNTGEWVFQDNSKETQRLLENKYYLDGTLYLESDSGVYYKKTPNEKVMISNATIRVCGSIEDWQSEEEYKEQLICEIRCDVWNGSVKTIEVPVEKYKQVYRLISKKYPAVSLATTGVDALEEYLTAVFQHKPENLQLKIRTDMIGWMNIRGKTRYYIGSDSFYKSVKLPDVTGLDKYYVFNQGLSFLGVGRNNAAIALVMLVAHSGYSLYWLRKGQADFRSVLYLKGKSNLLKTSVIREIANAFDINRDHSTIRVSSTLASLQYDVCMLRDGVICIDDFSNSESKSKSRSVEAVEDVIRAVGDGIFPTKMSMKGEAHVSRNTVRAAVILTGEEELGLGLSSNLRTIVVPVTEDTFDGKKLTIFQENQDIMRYYFSLYIQFITKYGGELSVNCRKAFVQYRAYYAGKLKIPRFIDAAAGLRVQTDFLGHFADWCGAAENEKIKLTELFERSIMDVMQQNQKSSGGKKPEIRFLYALMQSIGTAANSSLAENENIYIKDETNYLGFHEKGDGLIWLKMEDAWRIVKAYYRNQDEDWLVRQQTIKELLLKNGISKGKKMPDNQAGNEYLLKARKGSRKRMLVLRQAMVEKLLNTEEDN